MLSETRQPHTDSGHLGGTHAFRGFVDRGRNFNVGRTHVVVHYSSNNGLLREREVTNLAKHNGVMVFANSASDANHSLKVFVKRTHKMLVMR